MYSIKFQHAATGLSKKKAKMSKEKLAYLGAPHSQLKQKEEIIVEGEKLKMKNYITGSLQE